MGIALVLLGVAAGIGISHLWRVLGQGGRTSVRDPLTGLRLRDPGDRILRTLRPGDAVVMIDLDGLKAINDAAGHHAGDACLVDVARFLAASVRHDDAVLRWGGDEFVMVLRDARSGAASAVERLRVLSPFGFSAGLSVHTTGHGMTTLRAADTALLAAKRAGGHCVITA